MSRPMVEARCMGLDCDWRLSDLDGLGRLVRPAARRHANRAGHNVSYSWERHTVIQPAAPRVPEPPR